MSAFAARPGAARLTSSSGQALLTTMIACACLLPLGAFAAMQARLDWLIQHNTRAALEAFVVADSGLEHALADLSGDLRFDRLLAGPDGLRGTGDDGQYPFHEPPPQFFPRAPFRYEVSIAALQPDRVEITSRAVGALGATRAVVATVIRAADPFVAAALALEGRDVGLVLGSDFRVSGLASNPDATDLPALAVGDAAQAAALAARLPSGSAAQLTGRGGSPSLVGAVLPSAEAFADAAARRLDAQMIGGDLRGELGEGLFIAPQSLRMADASGSGVLVVRGALDISGASHFSGIVVALGDVSVGLGSEATVDGAVMVGQTGRAIALRGGGRIAHDARAIERVDALFPGLLPRSARVTGWREHGESP